MPNAIDPEFPYSLTIDLPLPTPRLALAALRSLSVDAELSPLVRRAFSTIAPSAAGNTVETEGADAIEGVGAREDQQSTRSILRTEYKATTNRMLRVAVNGFMESLGVVLGVMEELDVDVLGVDVLGDGKTEEKRGA